jgi:prolyl-tRNA synthetase
MDHEKNYKRLLIESNLFFAGSTKGSFILPPHGYSLWKNIQNVLDKKFAARGVQNVLLPSLIPLSLLEKEKKHIKGFNPECFYVEKTGEKQLSSPLVLRPTSEVLFYDWYRQILRSHQQLPFLYNQWCSVFRAEKNTSPFFRNTEFLWQEGHTIHSNSEEAQQFALSILADYQDYAENVLGLGIIVGEKSQGERFAGALKSYTIECLLPDGQCLQLATSHYFGDSFCRLMGVKFQNKDNQNQYPFSTSWGTSTRALGAVVKTHADNWGLILPFDIAPVQIAIILVGESQELINYYQEINSLLIPYYRCRLYNKNQQVNKNILQADQEGCPLKIILGSEELKKNEITLIRRDNVERRITISLAEDEIEKKYFSIAEQYVEILGEVDNRVRKEPEQSKQFITSFRKGRMVGKISNVINKESKELQKTIRQKSTDFRDKHIFSVDNFSELEEKLREGVKGLFLIPFCNNLDCERKIKEKVPAYSIRCISSSNKQKGHRQCLFCQSAASVEVCLGRSY